MLFSAFDVRERTDRDVFRVRSDGTALESLSKFASHDEGDPDFSPDGDWVLLTVGRGLDMDIAIMPNQVGGEVVRLIDSPAYDYAPQWSPDGQWIASLSHQNSAASTDLYRVSHKGSDRQHLGSFPQAISQAPVWSPPIEEQWRPLRLVLGVLLFNMFLAGALRLIRRDKAAPTVYVFHRAAS